jgi:hypothetical protein
MIQFAVLQLFQLIQPIAFLTHAHRNSPARRNHSVVEMLWRPAMSSLKYSGSFGHIHIRFTMSLSLDVDECVRKTTANSATDR